MTERATVRAMAPHYYVKPTAESVADGWSAKPHACARKGCGLPPEHTVHLRPPGDDPVQGILATGTDG